MVTDFEETTRLVYLTAVFKETLRLKNTVPFLAVWAKVAIQSEIAKDKGTEKGDCVVCLCAASGWLDEEKSALRDNLKGDILECLRSTCF